MATASRGPLDPADPHDKEILDAVGELIADCEDDFARERAAAAIRDGLEPAADEPEAQD